MSDLYAGNPNRYPPGFVISDDGEPIDPPAFRTAAEALGDRTMHLREHQARVRTQEWTTAGQYTWRVPVGVTRVLIDAVGGGGGGGGGGSCGEATPTSGGGGGSGGGGARLFRGTLAVTPGETLTVGVGSGGSGGGGAEAAGNNGGNGFDGGGSGLVRGNTVLAYAFGAAGGGGGPQALAASAEVVRGGLPVGETYRGANETTFSTGTFVLSRPMPGQGGYGGIRDGLTNAAPMPLVWNGSPTATAAGGLGGARATSDSGTRGPGWPGGGGGASEWPKGIGGAGGGGAAHLGGEERAPKPGAVGAGPGAGGGGGAGSSGPANAGAAGGAGAPGAVRLTWIFEVTP